MIAFLFSKCNCIQHFKLYKNRNWAINFVLMSKNKNVQKLKNPDVDVRGGGGFGNSDTPGQGEGGGFKIRDFGGRPL